MALFERSLTMHPVIILLVLLLTIVLTGIWGAGDTPGRKIYVWCGMIITVILLVWFIDNGHDLTIEDVLCRQLVPPVESIDQLKAGGFEIVTKCKTSQCDERNQCSVICVADIKATRQYKEPIIRNVPITEKLFDSLSLNSKSAQKATTKPIKENLN